MYKNKEWLNEQIKNNTDLEIALMCDASEATIARWRKRHKLTRSVPNYQNREWLTNEISLHGTSAKVAETHGYNTYTINDWCLKFGISKAERKKLRSGNLKSDFFTNIDEEKKAYWLGFLMADGTMKKDLSSVSINLKEEDLEHLEKFKKDLCSDALITNKTGGYGTVCKEIIISNKDMCLSLNYHGIIPRKTGRECLPDTVPNPMVRHFIRGFLDGGGHISKGDNYNSNVALDFSGVSHNIFHSIHDYFKSEGLISSDIKISKEKNTSCLHLRYYSSNAVAILNHIYKDSTIYLERKYSKFTQIQSSLTEM